MKGLVGGPLLVGGLGPGPPGPSLNPALPQLPESCKVNRQYGVGDSKYVVISDPYVQVT